MHRGKYLCHSKIVKAVKHKIPEFSGNSRKYCFTHGLQEIGEIHNDSKKFLVYCHYFQCPIEAHHQICVISSIMLLISNMKYFVNKNMPQ